MPRLYHSDLELELRLVPANTPPALMADVSTTAGATSQAQNEFVFNGATYFSANDGYYGAELWRTDGTASGTVLVRDIYVGPLPSYPGNFVACNGVLFFTARTLTAGHELWRTDGTSTGTTLVRDIVS